MVHETIAQGGGGQGVVTRQGREREVPAQVAGLPGSPFGGLGRAAARDTSRKMKGGTKTVDPGHRIAPDPPT